MSEWARLPCGTLSFFPGSPHLLGPLQGDNRVYPIEFVIHFGGFDPGSAGTGINMRCPSPIQKYFISQSHIRCIANHCNYMGRCVSTSVLSVNAQGVTIEFSFCYVV